MNIRICILCCKKIWDEKGIKTQMGTNLFD